MNESRADDEVLESLKNNEYLPKLTFEDFLAKKLGKGKRTLFVKRGPSENARAFMKEYMEESQARATAAAERRVHRIEEERLENLKHLELAEELHEIEIEKKAAMQE